MSHVVTMQGFRDPGEIDRFTSMFEEMCYIVATKHSGSLKGALLPPQAEHLQICGRMHVSDNVLHPLQSRLARRAAKQRYRAQLDSMASLSHDKLMRAGRSAMARMPAARRCSGQPLC